MPGVKFDVSPRLFQVTIRDKPEAVRAEFEHKRQANRLESNFLLIWEWSNFPSSRYDYVL